MLGWIVLKAELKSKYSILTCEFCLYMCLVTSFNSQLASWTLLFLQNANCSGSRNVSTLLHIYVFNIFSRHFIMFEVKTTGLKSLSTLGKGISYSFYLYGITPWSMESWKSCCSTDANILSTPSGPVALLVRTYIKDRTTHSCVIIIRSSVLDRINKIIIITTTLSITAHLWRISPNKRESSSSRLAKISSTNSGCR